MFHISNLFVSEPDPSVLSSSSLVNFLLDGFLFRNGMLLWPGRFDGGGGDPCKSLSLPELSEFQELLQKKMYISNTILL